MYLNQLNETQKKLFLDLAVALASADQDFSDDEKVMISLYCKEMEIDYYIPNLNNNINDTISELVQITDITEKKIIVFELMGLAIVDQNYDDSEKEIIQTLIEKFELPLGFDDECEKIIEDYMVIQNRINDLIL